VGYRAQFLANAGAVATHSEVALHAIDREMPAEGKVLVAGVGNGGSLEIWQSLGREVLGLDIDEKCRNLDLPIVICDVLDEGGVRGALLEERFTFIVDSTGTCTPWLWPYLQPGGRMILEDCPRIIELASDVAADRETWLPAEEIMRVSVYPRVAAIEKRNPRVVPYLDLAAGNFVDVTGERALIESGVRWVVV